MDYKSNLNDEFIERISQTDRAVDQLVAAMSDGKDEADKEFWNNLGVVAKLALRGFHEIAYAAVIHETNI